MNPKTIKLRRWQTEAVTLIVQGYKTQKSWLIVAGGGSGKTTFACAAMYELGKLGFLNFVVVSPAYSVKKAFAETANKFGISLDYNPDETSRGFEGVSVTYAHLSHIGWLKNKVTNRTVVILDEPHHLQEDEKSKWYLSTLKVLGGAGIIIMMTGTPWRSKANSKRIPFCRYTEVGKNQFEIVHDYSYPYARALKDNVVAEARFKLCRGTAQYSDKGKAYNIDLARTNIAEKDEPKVLRAITQVGGDFYDGMLTDSLNELNKVRTPENNYALLILCNDIDHAELTHRRLRTKFGVNAALAVGDSKDNESGNENASKAIEDFKVSRCPVIVSVLMISEGTDIPRIKVICYASLYRTFLFFCQVMFRACRKTMLERERFTMIVPAIPTFTYFARMIHEEITHFVHIKDLKPKLFLGREDSESSFDVKGSQYGEAEEYIPMTGYVESEAPLMTDIRDGLRRDCSELVTQYSGMVMGKTKGKFRIEKILTQIHVQANELVGTNLKQSEMGVEELTRKKLILTTWVAGHTR